jgi:hypothetical protein
VSAGAAARAKLDALLDGRSLRDDVSLLRDDDDDALDSEPGSERDADAGTAQPETGGCTAGRASEDGRVLRSASLRARLTIRRRAPAAAQRMGRPIRVIVCGCAPPAIGWLAGMLRGVRGGSERECRETFRAAARRTPHCQSRPLSASPHRCLRGRGASELAAE